MGLKAREIREHLQKDTDPRIVKFLCMMADDINQNERAIAEVAKLLDMLTDNMQLIQNAMGNITGVLDKMPAARKLLQSLKGTPGDQGGNDGHGSN